MGKEQRGRAFLASDAIIRQLRMHDPGEAVLGVRSSAIILNALLLKPCTPPSIISLLWIRSLHHADDSLS